MWQVCQAFSASGWPVLLPSRNWTCPFHPKRRLRPGAKSLSGQCRLDILFPCMVFGREAPGLSTTISQIPHKFAERAVRAAQATQWLPGACSNAFDATRRSHVCNIITLSHCQRLALRGERVTVGNFEKSSKPQSPSFVGSCWTCPVFARSTGFPAIGFGSLPGAVSQPAATSIGWL